MQNVPVNHIMPGGMIHGMRLNAKFNDKSIGEYILCVNSGNNHIYSVHQIFNEWKDGLLGGI